MLFETCDSYFYSPNIKFSSHQIHVMYVISLANVDINQMLEFSVVILHTDYQPTTELKSLYLESVLNMIWVTKMLTFNILNGCFLWSTLLQFPSNFFRSFKFCFILTLMHDMLNIYDCV